jgi:hypothetical protein
MRRALPIKTSQTRPWPIKIEAREGCRGPREALWTGRQLDPVEPPRPLLHDVMHNHFATVPGDDPTKVEPGI